MSDYKPNMVSNCKELFETYLKIGGKLEADFNRNMCTYYGHVNSTTPIIQSKNLHEIKYELQEFHDYHILHTPGIVTYEFNNCGVYPFHDNVSKMTIKLEFDKDGRY